MKKGRQEEDLDALIREYGRKRTCRVNESGRRDLIEALLSRKATAGLIERIMREKFDVSVSDSAVRYHALQTCACYR